MKRTSAGFALRTTLLLAGFAFSVTALQSARAQNYPNRQAGTSVGEVAPAFKLNLLNGRTVSALDFRGQTTVLVFWTSWCAFCKAEAPELNLLAQRYRASGVRLLGINVQDSAERTRAGVRSFGIRYPVARDADASVARLYRVTSTPTVIVLDALGIVTYRGSRLPENYAQVFSARPAQSGN